MSDAMKGLLTEARLEQLDGYAGNAPSSAAWTYVKELVAEIRSYRGLHCKGCDGYCCRGIGSEGEW